MAIKMVSDTPGVKTADTPDVETADDKASVVKASKGTEKVSKQDKPKAADPDAGLVTQSYVWLANGDVLRVENEDLPLGGHQTLGHWQRGDKVYQIVGIYPVEEKGLVDE
jgi:hypothetical protein